MGTILTHILQSRKQAQNSKWVVQVHGVSQWSGWILVRQSSGFTAQAVEDKKVFITKILILRNLVCQSIAFYIPFNGKVFIVTFFKNTFPVICSEKISGTGLLSQRACQFLKLWCMLSNCPQYCVTNFIPFILE